LKLLLELLLMCNNLLRTSCKLELMDPILVQAGSIYYSC
jgi:hypothetical protein